MLRNISRIFRNPIKSNILKSTVRKMSTVEREAPRQKIHSLNIVKGKNERVIKIGDQMVREGELGEHILSMNTPDIVKLLQYIIHPLQSKNLSNFNILTLLNEKLTASFSGNKNNHPYSHMSIIMNAFALYQMNKTSTFKLIFELLEAIFRTKGLKDEPRLFMSYILASLSKINKNIENEEKCREIKRIERLFSETLEACEVNEFIVMLQIIVRKQIDFNERYYSQWIYSKKERLTEEENQIILDLLYRANIDMHLILNCHLSFVENRKFRLILQPFNYCIILAHISHITTKEQASHILGFEELSEGEKTIYIKSVEKLPKLSEEEIEEEIRLFINQLDYAKNLWIKYNLFNVIGSLEEMNRVIVVNNLCRYYLKHNYICELLALNECFSMDVDYGISKEIEDNWEKYQFSLFSQLMFKKEDWQMLFIFKWLLKKQLLSFELSKLLEGFIVTVASTRYYKAPHFTQCFGLCIEIFRLDTEGLIPNYVSTNLYKLGLQQSKGDQLLDVIEQIIAVKGYSEHHMRQMQITDSILSRLHAVQNDKQLDHKKDLVEQLIKKMNSDLVNASF